MNRRAAKRQKKSTQREKPREETTLRSRRVPPGPPRLHEGRRRARRGHRAHHWLAGKAFAQDDVRAQILQIPGVGKGSPTDADWQKVGELCLGPTKANVAEGEFAGVELTFMGLNNQNLHNLLFRGFLKPWEAYTGAKINWIDLAQADYNARLQQAIATGTVDFDIIEMGAPFEGDVCGKGLPREMPDWVEDADRDGRLRRLPARRRSAPGTARPTASSIDGDCHTFTYRTDYFGDGSIAAAWNRGADALGRRRRPGRSGVIKGQKDPLTGSRRLRLSSIRSRPWGGFGFYFLGNRATAYAKHPDDKAWLFDPDTMKPRVNNPAWVRAIQDVIDALPTPSRRTRSTPIRTPPPSRSSSAAPARWLTWWGDVGSNVKTNDASVVGDVVGFSIKPGARRGLQLQDRRLGSSQRPELRARTWPISAGASTS